MSIVNNKIFIRSLFLLIPLVGMFGYGVIVGFYKVFPYQHLFSLKQLIKPTKVMERNREYRIKLFEEFSPPADIVFIGDSITQQGEWNEFFPSLKTSNRGVGGDMTSDVLKRMDSIYSVRAKTALIMLGINDIHRNVPLNTIITNYASILGLLKKHGQ